jgi:hypothetical protein
MLILGDALQSGQTRALGKLDTGAIELTSRLLRIVPFART